MSNPLHEQQPMLIEAATLGCDVCGVRTRRDAPSMDGVGWD
jgi:hypothetical protein